MLPADEDAAQPEVSRQHERRVAVRLGLFSVAADQQRVAVFVMKGGRRPRLSGCEDALRTIKVFVAERQEGRVLAAPLDTTEEPANNRGLTRALGEASFPVSIYVSSQLLLHQRPSDLLRWPHL